MKRRIGLTLPLILSLVHLAFTASADVRLPAIVADNMLLQQQMGAPIWGWAKPGETVTAAGSWGKKASATADDKGKWKVCLDTPSYGGPYTLTIKGNNEITIENVLIGEVCALRRRAAFANPLMNFDSVVCMLEPLVERRIVEAGRPFGYKPGGGPVIVSGFRSKPTVTRLLTGVTVSSGAWKGKTLTEKFAGLELDYDAQQILFSATTDKDVWHIFKYGLASKKLDQLTNNTEDDFDPCFLPSGRIAFVSTRVGGIGRCLLHTQSLTYALHSMEADGSDIISLSYHETNEWQPSVNNQGLIVYTRWDYLDRDWSTAHHHWLCYPDGTASKYTATAVGHHEGFSGSLVLVDTNVPDDGKMSQVKRITPPVSFPGSGARCYPCLRHSLAAERGLLLVQFQDWPLPAGSVWQSGSDLRSRRRFSLERPFSPVFQDKTAGSSR